MHQPSSTALHCVQYDTAQHEGHEETECVGVCPAVCGVQVTFQLARILTGVHDIQQVPRRITDLLAAGGDITEAQAFFSNTRQPLEWTLRQVRLRTPVQRCFHLCRSVFGPCLAHMPSLCSAWRRDCTRCGQAQGCECLRTSSCKGCCPQCQNPCLHRAKTPAPGVVGCNDGGHRRN
jgi:hypothetical protein